MKIKAKEVETTGKLITTILSFYKERSQGMFPWLHVGSVGYLKKVEVNFKKKGMSWTWK